MSNQRIDPVDPPYPEELQRSFEVVMPPGKPPLNIFRTLGRNPRVLSRIVHGGLLDKGSVTISQRELVILRACARCRAEYEWGVHVALFAAKAGFSERQLADTCSEAFDPTLWSPEQQVLLKLVDELHCTATVSHEVWSEAARYFEDEQLVELITLAGLYHAVSFMVNAFHVEREGFAPGFPGE